VDIPFFLSTTHNNMMVVRKIGIYVLIFEISSIVWFSFGVGHTLLLDSDFALNDMWSTNSSVRNHRCVGLPEPVSQERRKLWTPNFGSR